MIHVCLHTRIMIPVWSQDKDVMNHTSQEFLNGVHLFSHRKATSLGKQKDFFCKSLPPPSQGGDGGRILQGVQAHVPLRPGMKYSRKGKPLTPIKENYTQARMRFCPYVSLWVGNVMRMNTTLHCGRLCYVVACYVVLCCAVSCYDIVSGLIMWRDIPSCNITSDI